MSGHDVGEVVKLAAALQARADLDVRGELTLEQYEAIAAEVGLAPEYVRQAVALLGAGQPHIGKFMGLPQAVVLEREFDSELAADHHDVLVEAIRRRTGLHGTVETTGRTVTWLAQRSHSTLRVTAVALPGKTRLRVEQLHRNFLAAVYGGVVGVFGTLAAVAAGELAWSLSYSYLPTVLAGAAAFVAAFVAARAMARSTIDSDAEELNDLMIELAGTVQPLLPPGSRPTL